MMDINQLYINAVKQGNLAEAEQLILQGANVDTPDEDGMISLITAAKYGHTDIVNLILTHNVFDSQRDDKIYAAMWYAIYGGFIDIVQIFLDNGADVNRTTADGYTPLMIAVTGGKYEVVEFLLKHGADVSYTNSQGHSALLVAEAAERADLKDLLEEYREKQRKTFATEDDDKQGQSGRRLEL